MDDKSLIELLAKMRSRLNEYRESDEGINSGTLGAFFINVIQISISLSEIGLTRNRAMSIEEEYWFGASYNLNFELVGGPFEDLYDSYQTLSSEIKRRNFFRIDESVTKK